MLIVKEIKNVEANFLKNIRIFQKRVLHREKGQLFKEGMFFFFLRGDLYSFPHEYRIFFIMSTLNRESWAHGSALEEEKLPEVCIICACVHVRIFLDRESIVWNIFLRVNISNTHYALFQTPQSLL